MADVDAVVIGAGPNGLVAANVLADAGWSVAVVEAQPEPGGAVRSAELIEPGFVHDRFSAFYPLAAASPVIRRLGLGAYGLRWQRAPLVLAHPGPGRPAALLSMCRDETAASLDAFAPGDGDAWRATVERWDRIEDAFLDALLSPFPPVRGALRLGARLGPRGVLDFARTGILPARRLGEEMFAGVGGRLLLAGLALHTDLAPDSATSGLFGWILACLGQRIGFPVPKGGSGALSRALWDRAEARGASLSCNQPVTQVIIQRGRAAGVQTADGTTISAKRAVLADVGAPALYRNLVGEEHLPDRVVRALTHFEYDHATVKVDWALDGPVPWEDPNLRRAGTVHLGDSVDALTWYSTQLTTGWVPDRPYLVIGQMTTTDPTRSPAGTETLWAYTHVPARVRRDAAASREAGAAITGRWDDSEKSTMADRIEAEIEARAPGFRSLVRGRHVAAPPDLEATDANLVHGAVNGGTAALHQQLVFRPVPGLGRAETPVAGLYLASASAHPGGGVHGACGANAARAALAAARRRLVPLAGRRAG